MKNSHFELENLKTIYYKRIDESDERSFELIPQIKSLMDQMVHDGRANAHYFEISLQNIMALYIKCFPLQEMSLQYFHYITDWFVKNYSIIDSLKTDSERLYSDLKNENEVNVEEVNVIKRIKNRIPVLLLLKDTHYFMTSESKSIFEEWIFALQSLI